MQRSHKQSLLKVDSGSFELRIGDKVIEAKTQAELYGGIEAGNASGALACLDAWRKMLRDGPSDSEIITIAAKRRCWANDRFVIG